MLSGGREICEYRASSSVPPDAEAASGTAWTAEMSIGRRIGRGWDGYGTAEVKRFRWLIGVG